MVLRFKPTPTHPDLHSLYEGGQYTLAFKTKCVMSMGRHAVVRIGYIRSVTLKCGVICRHNSADKLVIHLIMRPNDCMVCVSENVRP